MHMYVQLESDPWEKAQVIFRDLGEMIQDIRV